MKWTRQELFDTITEHLLQQGRQSINAWGKCVYRAPNGDRCAVGVVIPDKYYDPRFDKFLEPVSCIVTRVPHLREHEGLLRNMQMIHDNLPSHSSPEEFRSRFLAAMMRYAREHDIVWKNWERWTPESGANAPKIV